MSYTWNSYPNIPFMGVLPCGISNFGGDTQVFTIDEDLFAATNPYLLFNPLATAMINQKSGGSAMPQINLPKQEEIDALANALAAPVIKSIDELNQKMITQSISTSIDNLATTKTRLNSLLSQEGLSDEDKQKVNDLLKEIQEQEDKLNELNQKIKDMDQAEALKQIHEIEDKIREIVSKAGAIKAPEAAKKAEQAEEAAEKEKAQATEKQGGVLNPGAKDKTEKESPLKPQKDKQEQTPVSGKKEITEEHIQIADMFHDAITGPGTDNATFDAVCEYLNKDNVVEVMVAYEQTYGKSFMDAFMDDADSGFCCTGGQKVKYGRHIARALRARAIESGVYKDCKDEFHNINKEMDSTLWVDNDVYEDYDSIADAIAEKDGLV